MDDENPQSMDASYPDQQTVFENGNSYYNHVPTPRDFEAGGGVMGTTQSPSLDSRFGLSPPNDERAQHSNNMFSWNTSEDPDSAAFMAAFAGTGYFTPQPAFGKVHLCA